MKLLITMFDSRLSLDREINKHLTDQGYDRFEKPIRTNTKLAEAFGLRKSIFDYAPSSTGAMDYDTLAGEMIQ
jgi:chromosome partitioning protein